MSLQRVRPPVIQNHDDPYQRQARTAIQTLDSPELRKVTVRGVILGTSTVNVPHTMGKAPNNWSIVDKNAQADVWHDTSLPVTNDFFPLKASATVTVAIQFWA